MNQAPNGLEKEDYGYETRRQARVDLVPASCQLNQEFVNRVRQPITCVWNSIAADVHDDEDINNENVIEWCIDADHLELIGGDKEANDLVREQCKVHGYTRVLKYLARNIILY